MEWTTQVLIASVLLGVIIRFSAGLKFWIRSCLLALKMPGPFAYPLLGSMMCLTDNAKLAKFGRTAYELYGPIFRGWMSIIPIFITFEPKYMQIILGSTKHTDKQFLYTFLHNFVGQGLITNNGMKWKRNRKLIQPYFRINLLEKFIPVFCESSKMIVEGLRHVGACNVTSRINDCILDVLHKSVLGVSEQDLLIDNQWKESPFRKGNVSLVYRITRPWFLINFFYGITPSAGKESQQKQDLQQYTRKILELRREGKIARSKCKSLMEMCMEISEKNPEFTDDDIINEVCTFMLAGQDSVAAAVAFCLHYLAKHEEIQTKVRKELDEVMEDPQKTLDMTDLKEMKYLQQCIKETLRLCPSVPIFARTLSEGIKIGNYTFPVGSSFVISPFATHRLKHLYPNPEKFDPDRFLPENEDKLPHCAFLPFSTGPRNCIGYKFAMLEMETILGMILRNYTISLVPNRDFTLSYRVTLRAHGGIWLNFQKR